MSRDNLGEQLSAFLDGELSEGEAIEVRALLAESAAARTRLAELREVSERLRGLPRVAAPAALAEMRSQWQPRRTVFGNVPRGWRLVMWLQGGVGVAACVGLFFLGTLAGWNARRLVEVPRRPETSTPIGSLEANRYKEKDARNDGKAPPALQSEPEGTAVVQTPGNESDDTVSPSANVAESMTGNLAASSAGNPVEAAEAPSMRWTLAPGTLDEYRQQVETLQRWSAATQRPPLVRFDAGIADNQQPVAGGRAVVDASAAINSFDLQESFLYLSAEQARELMRELSPQRSARVQVDARAEQMASIEPVLAAGDATSAGGGAFYAAPPPPGLRASPAIRASDSAGGSKEADKALRPPKAPAKSGGKAPTGAKETAGRKAGLSSKPAPAAKSPEIATSTVAPAAERQVPTQPSPAADLMGPPFPASQQFIALHFTLLPPADLIEREATSEPAAEE